MKKIITALAVIAATASLAFAGDVSVSLDAQARVWQQNADETKGFNVVSGDDYFANLMFNYDSEFGGGFFRIRNYQWNANMTNGGAFTLNRWGVYVKSISQLKISYGTGPYEVFSESINWEPIFGAGLFETGTPHVMIEAFPISGLSLGLGIPAENDDGTVGLTEEPFSAMEAFVKYDIGGVGNVAVEYSSTSNNLTGLAAADGWKNGDIKRIGVQFNYTGVEKLSALVGYSAVLASGDAFDNGNKALKALGKDEASSLAQNRVELFVTYSGIDKLSLSLYEAALLRGTGWGDFGNRVAFKAAYQVTDKLCIWTRENYFMNYGGNGFGWGGYQLKNSANKDQSALRAELFANYDFGAGVGASVGFRLDKDTSTGDAKVADKNSMSYYIPVGISINF